MKGSIVMTEDHRGYLKIEEHKWYDILGLKREEDSHHIAYSMCKLAESVAKLHDVVMALDARVAKLEKAVEGLRPQETPELQFRWLEKAVEGLREKEKVLSAERGSSWND